MRWFRRPAQPPPASRGTYRSVVRDRLRANPEDPDALFAQAAYLAVDGRTREALGVLHELAKVDPHHPGLWRFKARLYAEIGEAKFASLCASREDPSSSERRWKG